MTISEAVRVLLDGGYIAEMCPHSGKLRKYTVHERNDVYGIASRITPSQFYELSVAGVIEFRGDSKTNKYGDIINFYELRKREAKNDT